MQEGTITAQPRAQIFIERPRLTRLLDDYGGRIILLIAPAGYGKTTLARQWTAEQDRVGWYAGSPAMVDVAGLSVELAETLGAMGDPRHADMIERVRILAARGHDPRGLAKAVSVGAPGADWLLVVDDYHHAAGVADAEAFFEELAGRTEFRLLITSRERPGWLSARRVVYGEVVVVEMDALAFTDEEARVVLGSDEAGQLLAEARGWPVVIGLAAMRGATDVTAGLPPDDLYRFFADDLFRSARPELRDAMFRFALTGDAGVEGARELLGSGHVELVDEAAERGFLTPEGRQALHPLLRGFLLAKLAELDRAEIRPLLAQAVDFLAARKRWDDCLFALEHFPEDELILSTLTRGLADTLDSGRVVTVIRWVELARQRELMDPVVSLATAEVALRQRDDRTAEALGERAGELLGGDLAARAYLVAARAAHLRDNDRQTLRLCKLAVASAKSDRPKVEALWVQFGHALGRSTKDSARAFAELRAFAGTSSGLALRLRTAEAILVGQRGDVLRAIELLEGAAALMPDVADPFARTNVLHFLAYMNLLAAEYEESLAASARLIAESRDLGLEFAVDHGLLHQVGAYIGMRKIGRAQRTINELQRRSASASSFVVENIDLQRARLALATGDADRAHALLDKHSDAKRLTFRGEVCGYKAVLLAARGDIRASHAILGEGGECFDFAESRSLRDIALVIIGLQMRRGNHYADAKVGALIHNGHGDAVVTGLRAYPNLVRVCAASEELRISVMRLLARSHDFDIARAGGLKVPRDMRRPEGLSVREQEVYELLAQGRTNHQIAQTLFISESTTKVHVRHIFEKLGVHSRAEAARLMVRDVD